MGGKIGCHTEEDGSKEYCTGLDPDGVVVRTGGQMAEVEGVEEVIGKSKGAIFGKKGLKSVMKRMTPILLGSVPNPSRPLFAIDPLLQSINLRKLSTSPSQ
ncbi:hypothetical protein L1987_02066 [Smallanthus sonchifolius]|uniref:Uncharacterized protein n=1 Tax=Smallanthus sonchifolius TaxID=185202 RepID=A0ACB9K6S5_9ASTR|nr:hypothetical protein L1987_02066 [Smallanthus sonchifolius]